MTTWKTRLGATGEDLLARQGPLRVLVDLARPEADETILESLATWGLAVEEVIGNKIVATVPGERLQALRDLPEVAEVEVAALLRPHGE